MDAAELPKDKPNIQLFPIFYVIQYLVDRIFVQTEILLLSLEKVGKVEDFR